MSNALGDTEHIPKGASTTTKLHESAHRLYNHSEGDIPIDKFVSDELDAEIWAWKHMERELTWRVARPVMVDLVEEFKFKPNYAFNLVVNTLKAKGIVVSKKGKSELWDQAIRLWKRRVGRDDY